MVRFTIGKPVAGEPLAESCPGMPAAFRRVGVPLV